MGLGAAEGAYYNVMINLKGIEDGAFRDATSREARALLEQAEKLAAEIRDIVRKELEG